VVTPSDACKTENQRRLIVPQSERSLIIKEFLRWIEAKTKQGGASYQECIRHIQLEITEMGAEEKRCKKYVQDCDKAGLINTKGLKFNITDKGVNWLQRKGA